MWTQSDRRHHRDAAQEEQHVSRVQVRKGLMKVDLVVRPLELPDHPERTAHGGQRPEKISPPMGGAGIQEQPCICEKRHDALHQVAKRRATELNVRLAEEGDSVRAP